MNRAWDPTEAARLVWGLTLLAVPGRVLTHVHRSPSAPLDTAVLRVLGARHVTQALLAGRRSSPRARSLGAVVDVLHASSAVPLAMTAGPRTSAGRFETVLGTAWALAELRASRCGETVGLVPRPR